MGLKTNNCGVCGVKFSFPKLPNTQPWRSRFCTSMCLDIHAKKEKLIPYSRKRPHKIIEYKKCVYCQKEITANPRRIGKKKKKNKSYSCQDCFQSKSPTVVVKRKKTSGSKSFLKDISKNNQSSDFYTDGRWRVLRYEFLLETKGSCSACGHSAKDGKKMHVDHIKPRATHPELEYEKSNLQILCDDCNLGKGAWDDTDWRQK